MSAKSRLVPRKKTVIIAGVIAVMVIGIMVALIVINSNKPVNSTTAQTNNSINPGYPTVLPNGKSASDLGAQLIPAPNNGQPVFAYADTIGTVSIKVSEQPLPASFKNDADAQLAEVAKGYNATTQLTAGNTKVYIGLSAKGPQSVLFVKNNLLILIVSQQKIADKDWINYIQSLS